MTDKSYDMISLLVTSISGARHQTDYEQLESIPMLIRSLRRYDMSLDGISD